MVLDKLHIFKRHARVIRQGHAVTVLYVGVGRERKNPAAPSRAEDDRFRSDGLDAPGGDLDGNDALAAPVVHQKPGDKPFVESLDRFVLQACLEQSVKHMKSGLVGSEPRPLGFHTAEWPHGHAAVGVSAPGATPVLELYHFRRSFFHKNLYGVLVAHPVAA